MIYCSAKMQIGRWKSVITVSIHFLFYLWWSGWIQNWFLVSICFVILYVELSVEISSLHLSCFFLSLCFCNAPCNFLPNSYVFDFLWIFVCVFCSALLQTTLFFCSFFSVSFCFFNSLFSLFALFAQFFLFSHWRSLGKFFSLFGVIPW